jgi:hypothetical protein
MPDTSAQAARCETCPFRHDSGPAGLQCRRRSPMPDSILRLAVWPTVKAGDFCAEHPDFTPAAPLPAQAPLPL